MGGNVSKTSGFLKRFLKSFNILSILGSTRPSAHGAWIRSWRVYEGLKAFGGLRPFFIYRLKCSCINSADAHTHTEVSNGPLVVQIFRNQEKRAYIVTAVWMTMVTLRFNLKESTENNPFNLSQYVHLAAHVIEELSQVLGCDPFSVTCAHQWHGSLNSEYV